MRTTSPVPTLFTLLGYWTWPPQRVLTILPAQTSSWTRRRSRFAYYHAWAADNNNTQVTFVALSSNGLDFVALPHQLGRPYFRVFKYNDWYYALSKDYYRGGMFQRSPVADGFSQEFEYGNSCIDRKRHSAVWVQGDNLYIFYTRVRDMPEAIYITRVSLNSNWTSWQPCAHGHLLLRPEMDYEGADLPVRTSRAGSTDRREHELRDPGIYEEGGRVYLLYSMAGEDGIAMAELMWTELASESIP